MVVGASSPLITIWARGARFGAVIKRMILKFFPSVTFVAVVLVFAAIFILGDKIVGFPVLACYLIVLILVRLSPVILPVVGVDALAAIMGKIVERAPDCFVVEDEEIVIEFVVVNQLDGDVIFWMRERAVGSIFTWSTIFGKLSTILCLIFIRRIKLFYLIMSLGTFITKWTIFSILLSKLTHIWYILDITSSPIFLRMVKLTLFMIVTLHIITGVNFEDGKFQML